MQGVGGVGVVHCGLYAGEEPMDWAPVDGRGQCGSVSLWVCQFSEEPVGPFAEAQCHCINDGLGRVAAKGMAARASAGTAAACGENRE